MKYLIIIIILFLFIFYYNIVLSQKSLLLEIKEKKYNELKKKLAKKNSLKSIIKPSKKEKKVDFIIDDLEPDNMIDSIFSDGENEMDSFNAGESFALESLEL